MGSGSRDESRRFSSSEKPEVAMGNADLEGAVPFSRFWIAWFSARKTAVSYTLYTPGKCTLSNFSNISAESSSECFASFNFFSEKRVSSFIVNPLQLNAWFVFLRNITKNINNIVDAFFQLVLSNGRHLVGNSLTAKWRAFDFLYEVLISLNKQEGIKRENA